MTSSVDVRPYKVVVLGATGFTGLLTAEYLARTVGASIPWAIAGRNLEKLNEVKRKLEAIDPACANVGLITANTDDFESIKKVTAATHVLLTTVGPYHRYGEPVVHACVETSTDYVDITGEPAFVSAMVARYGSEAESRKIKIVNTCGFDSVPHDLGVLFTVLELPQGVPITVEGFVRAKGTASGGTWHTAIESFGKLRESIRAGANLPHTMHDRKAEVIGIGLRMRYDRGMNCWAVSLPTIDPQVVLRSARVLDRYGPEFRYGHYARIRSATTMVSGVLGVGALVALAQFKPTRNLLLKWQAPGEGPSPERRARSRFEVTFRGTGGGRTVLTQVSGGDPGYDETAKMVAESALCLALDRDQLPPYYGVVTPAVAMGERLIDRLKAAGMRFEVIG